MKNKLSIKKSYCLILFLVFTTALFSQSPVHKLVAYDKEVYIADTNAFRLRKNELYKKYEPLFENEIWLKDYVKGILSYEQSLAAYGGIYKNWEEASVYLNKIIKEVVGKEWKENIVVQIRRDEENNAFMIEDGKIYINVGMIASVDSEAELAATIGHEYGHYKAQHHYKDYIKMAKLMGKIKTARLIRYPGAGLVALSGVSNYFSNSREDETEADNTSIEMMKASKYNMGAIVSDFKHFYDEEKKQAREKGHKNFVYYHTHPPTTERMMNAEKEFKKTDTTGRKNFVINKTLFDKIKKQAIDECIFLSLRKTDFQNVIESCYTQLLYYPDDEFYLFYLNEALRRYLMINKQEENNYFITSHYSIYERYIPLDKQAKVSLSKKMPKINGSELNKIINYQSDFLLLNNDKAKLSSLPKNYLTLNDTVEFTTYKEALNFFISRQKKLNQSSVNFVLKMMKPDTTVAPIKSANEDLNFYNEVITAFNTKVSEPEVAIIPLDLDYYKDEMVFWKMDLNEATLYSQVVKNLQNVCRYPFYIIEYQKLSLTDKLLLYDFLTTMKQFALEQKEIDSFYRGHKNRDNDMYKAVALKTSLLVPEIIPFLKKNHLGKMMFLDISLSEVTSGVSVGPMGGMPLGSTKISDFANVYIDTDSPVFVSQHIQKKGGGKTVFTAPLIAGEIYQMAQSLANDVKNNRKE